MVRKYLNDLCLVPSFDFLCCEHDCQPGSVPVVGCLEIQQQSRLRPALSAIKKDGACLWFQLLLMKIVVDRRELLWSREQAIRLGSLALTIACWNTTMKS